MRAFRFRSDDGTAHTRPFQPPLAAVGMAIATPILAIGGAGNEAIMLAGGCALFLAALRG